LKCQPPTFGELAAVHTADEAQEVNAVEQEMQAQQYPNEREENQNRFQDISLIENGFVHF
jgi:hypothetical protein